MKKRLKGFLAVVLSICMILSMTAFTAADEPETPTETTTSTLKVGAGEGTIDYSTWSGETDFPEARKGFGPDSIHDAPHARVILIDNGTERVAIVSLEIVQISSDLSAIQEVVSEKLDVDIDNIWVHTTHSVTTPHSDGSEEFVKIITDAVAAACDEALDTFQPAVMGVATGTCDINSNRNIVEPEGVTTPSGSKDTTFYSAPNVTELPNNEDMEIVGESNEKMTVVGFISAETGDPITYYVSYGVKPNTIDAVGFNTAGSMISSDTPGYACTYAEDEVDVPVMFCMSAAGDQTTDMSAKIYGYDENGEWAYLELGTYEECYDDMVVPLGTEMGTSILDIIEDIEYTDDAPEITLSATSFTADTQNKDGSWGTTEVPVSTMVIGELALVGVQPEIDAATDILLQESSPYEYTCLVSFLNGDGKYMPHAEAYDYNDGKGTYEVYKTSYAKGTAEQMVETAVELLEGVYTTAADEIESIFVDGAIQVDGVKAQYITIEYASEIDPDSVSLDDYEVTDYCTITNPTCKLGSDPGTPIDISVEGNKVIIELNNDYQLGSVPGYAAAMAAGITQVGAISTVEGDVIHPSYSEISNYTYTTSAGMNGTSYSFTVDPDTYAFTGVEDYIIFEGEDAFHAENCYSETYSNYASVDLPYALYVPEDYDAEGNYALTIYIPDSGANGESPMIGLTTTKAATNLASEEVQNMVKKQGLDGMIVLVPQFSSVNGNTAWKVTSDNFTVSYGLPATLQLIDTLLEDYAIDTNRIYGIGQSQGGMMLEAIAAQRDNFLAGIWAIGCEWGNNYNKEWVYSGVSYGTSDDDTIWTEDYENFFYLVSDDNILFTTGNDDAFASGCTKELKVVYEDFADVEIPQVEMGPVSDSLEDQEDAYEDLLAMDNDTNIYWAYLQDTCGHNDTWIYAHKTMTPYQWLFSQTKEDEDNRDKLEILNNQWVPETDPDVIAASQTEDRLIAQDTEGNDVYYAVPAEGAGTKGYNSVLYGRGAKQVMRAPGWISITINEQPENQLVAVGEKATLSVDAETTTDSISYQWMYTVDGGDTWKTCTSSGSTKASFSFKMYKNFSGRYYVCAITDAVGNTVYTDPVLVSTPIVITEQPEDTAAAVGETATLSVAATGDGLTYQWEYTVDGGETWKTCTSSASKKASFSFKMYKNFAGRTYRCVVTNAAGVKVTSEEAALTLSK